MALPTNVDTCQVTGAFVTTDGVPAVGTVEFIPTPAHLVNVAAVPPTTLIAAATVVQLVSGAFTVTLPATDDADLNPTDWTYLCRVRVSNGAPYSFYMNAPAGDLDLASVTPVSCSTGEVVAGGNVGDVVWVGDDPPADATVELWWDTDAIGGGGAGSGSAPTVDTGEMFQVIMFSDGTVRAIPVDATAPEVPAEFAREVRVNSVRLTWAAVTGATSYVVYRDAVQYATTTTNSYRDGSVVVGTTYDYALRAANGYGLRSDLTPTVTAFIDPTLNVAPTVEVRSWPATIALGNQAIIRVNAIDVDAQLLAFTLGTDVGSLVATADPSVWILTPS